MNYDGIAPADIIQKDYLFLLRDIELRMSSKYKNLLLMQSVIGHAQSGHESFRDFPYPNTTMDDIVDALTKSNDKRITQGLGKISKKRIKEMRDEVIEILKSPFERIIAGEDILNLTDQDGEPLLGISTLKDARIKSKEAFLLGGYLASVMDTYHPWRKAVEENYMVRMGGGECVAVNVKNLPENLTLEDLAESEFGKAIDVFKKEGIVVDLKKHKGRRIKSSDTIQNAYIRHRVGRGVSDDAAIIVAGLLYGEEAFWGAFLLDAIDTWDKYATYIIEGGADEAFGKKLKKHISVKESEVLKFIYLSRKDTKYPDSSQRYFLEIDPKVNQTALESHLRFVRGERVKEMNIGYRIRGLRRIKNTAFYRRLRQRIEKFG